MPPAAECRASSDVVLDRDLLHDHRLVESHNCSPCHRSGHRHQGSLGDRTARVIRPPGFWKAPEARRLDIPQRHAQIARGHERLAIVREGSDQIALSSPQSCAASFLFCEIPETDLSGAIARRPAEIRPARMQRQLGALVGGAASSLGRPSSQICTAPESSPAAKRLPSVAINANSLCGLTGHKLRARQRIVASDFHSRISWSLPEGGPSICHPCSTRRR